MLFDVKRRYNREVDFTTASDSDKTVNCLNAITLKVTNLSLNINDFKIEDSIETNQNVRFLITSPASKVQLGNFKSVDENDINVQNLESAKINIAFDILPKIAQNGNSDKNRSSGDINLSGRANPYFFGKEAI